MRHGAGETLPRHCHREAFAAIVLAGGYDEAGDTGRHRVAAGDVIFHRAFESHLDRFHRPGAEVLVIPLDSEWAGPTLGTVGDADAVMRAAEKDRDEALHILAATVQPKRPQVQDWPDLLAALLRSEPSLSLAAWADQQGLHRGSLSRGFASVFGIAPSAYRRIQRARRAIQSIADSDAPLSQLALECGFADQAHMCREVAAVAGVAPGALRKRG